MLCHLNQSPPHTLPGRHPPRQTETGRHVPEPLPPPQYHMVPNESAYLEGIRERERGRWEKEREREGERERTVKASIVLVSAEQCPCFTDDLITPSDALHALSQQE